MVNQIQRVSAILIGSLVLLWITALHKQPFFFYDTVSYIRGPDAAVVKLLGPSFSTQWTISRSFLNTPNSAESERTAEDANHIMSLKDGIVLSGRSIFYGLLLYCGELSGTLWLAAIFQSVVLAYLLNVLIVDCLVLSTTVYLTITVILACCTTAALYVGFLMPDLFTGLAILALAILLGWWDALDWPNRAALAIVLAYSTMCHAANVLICGSILAAYSIVSLSTKSQRARFDIRLWSTVAGCILVAILGNAAFDVVVTKVVGSPPIRPPFVTARLVELGPGYKYLASECAHQAYTACKFVDKLPLTNDDFLWSRQSGHSVFATASPEVKRALGNEQYRFFADVFLFDPLAVLSGILSGFVDQFLTFGASEFFLSTDEISDVPLRYQVGSSVVFETVLSLLSGVHTFTLLVAVAILFAFFVPIRHREVSLFGLSRVPAWTSAAILLGVTLNPLFCGILSTTHDRYQARVIWLIPLLAAIFVSSLIRSEGFGAGRSGKIATRESLISRLW